MRGIVLAGGTGSRLWPATFAVSKQLVPVYDKPMVYYPLSVLLLSGIKDILIISTPLDTPAYQRLLADGGQWGISLSYAVQATPEGIADAFVIGSEFIGNHSCALTLGDNLFHGAGLTEILCKASTLKKGAQIFACRVDDPCRYGVVTLDKNGKAVDLEEKPVEPKSGYAVTGLYFYDNTVVGRARSLNPSERNELEITDLNRTYLDDDALRVEVLGQDVAWLDMGAPDSLMEAARYVEALVKNQGTRPGCPEEICWRMGHIDDQQLEKLADELQGTGYGRYLAGLPDRKTAATASSGPDAVRGNRPL